MGSGIRSVSRHRILPSVLNSLIIFVRVYYQHNPNRLACCPVTIHAVLHIADSIEATGPVWCYWAFPMERYCGVLKRAIRSRRFPYASLSRFVFEKAQLAHIANEYNIASILALQAPPPPLGNFSHPDCMMFSSTATFRTLPFILVDPTCVLLFPRSQTRPTQNLMNSIAAALATRFDVEIRIVKDHLKNADVEEWGRIRRVDSDAGDTMRASSMVAVQDDTRDATYVRVNLLHRWRHSSTDVKVPV